jgi:hypothetical protein
VFATCELNRGSYRTSDPVARVADLAAFKESGGIEYGASVALVLRSVKDEPDLVDVAFAKNRLGPRPEFRLRLDRTRAVFTETGGTPTEADHAAVQAAKLTAERARLREAVLAAVRKAPPVHTKDALCLRVPHRRTTVWPMLTALEDEGVLVKVGGVYRVASDPSGDES